MTHTGWNQLLSLPNGVTAIRIVAIPFVLFFLYRTEKAFQILSAFLFLLVALTDWVDGYFARRQKRVTVLGKFFDPLADKLLIVTALIGLIPCRGIPSWMVIVIVGREIAVTGLRGMAITEGIVISASPIGKYKTAFEMASVFFLLLPGSILSVDFQLIGMVLLWLALILAVVSGIDYFRKFLGKVLG
ncbi:MAG: CDP-diacylglycerol--glycerol-3-phosphate 3-phosphatidyltransferase [Desulfobacterota bacterium]|nr:CDP-diacylglycerol--glycerol-3-phosphate 3-phosphatidyltransferase [Thermodesulfobacteriota bacterium]